MLCCSDVMEQVSDQMELLNAFPLLMVMDVTGKKTTASVRLIEAMAVKQIFKKMEKFDGTTMGYYLKNPVMKIEASIIKCSFPRGNCRWLNGAGVGGWGGGGGGGEVSSDLHGINIWAGLNRLSNKASVSNKSASCAWSVCLQHVGIQVLWRSASPW